MSATPFLQDADLTLYVGDCLDVLAGLPDGSVDCVVTSPPYWGLRDYGTAGQLGLESTPDEYVARMVAVFREVRRVLAAHGTCWVNLGDSYISGQGGRQSANGELPSTSRFDRPAPKERPDLPNPPSGWATRAVTRRTYPGADTGWKPKDLAGMPWRVAFALQTDGWYLRSDIIWSKPNPMPESVTDRPTKAHEYVFLLSKGPRYWFDAEAVREPATSGSDLGLLRSRTRDETGMVSWGAPSIAKRQAEGVDSRYGNPSGGRNIRSVWEIATQPYAGAHFATYPEELVRRCILAGCPEWVCGTCGRPRVRVTSSAPDPDRPQAKRALEIAAREGLTDAHLDALRACGISDVGKALVTTNGTGKNDPAVQALADEAREKLGGYAREFLIRGRTETLGWSDCGHDNYRPGITLDPFLGSGTTALVARKHARHCVGIELNPEYARLAAERTKQLSLLGEPV